MAARGKNKRRKRNQRKRSQAELDFIKGRTDRIALPVESLKPKLGYSPTLATASGSGAHGGSRRAQHKRNRRTARQELRNGNWD